MWKRLRKQLTLVDIGPMGVAMIGVLLALIIISSAFEINAPSKSAGTGDLCIRTVPKNFVGLIIFILPFCLNALSEMRRPKVFHGVNALLVVSLFVIACLCGSNKNAGIIIDMLQKMLSVPCIIIALHQLKEKDDKNLTKEALDSRR